MSGSFPRTFICAFVRYINRLADGLYFTVQSIALPNTALPLGWDIARCLPMITSVEWVCCGGVAPGHLICAVRVGAWDPCVGEVVDQQVIVTIITTGFSSSTSVDVALFDHQQAQYETSDSAGPELPHE